MKAKEAEQKAIGMKPIHNQKIKDEAIKNVYKAINDAVNEGRGSITGGWHLQQIGMGLILDKLKEDGYYVRYNYTGGGMDCVIAWGEKEIIQYKLSDESRLAKKEVKVSDKKWWKIFPIKMKLGGTYNL